MQPDNPYTGYTTYNQGNTSRRRLILLAAGAVGAIALIILIVTLLTRGSYGTLQVSAPKKTQDNASVSVTVQGTDFASETFTLKPGESKQLRVKTGDVRVDGVAGTIKAVDVATITKSKTTKLTTPSGEQRAIKQLGSDARYCPIVTGSQVYSFSCSTYGAIVQHTPTGVAGASDNAFIFDGQVVSEGMQYKDGILGYIPVSDEQQDLTYVDLSNQSQNPVPLNKEVLALYRHESPIIVVSSEPGDSRFAMLFLKANSIYIFTDYTDTSPVKITPGKDVRMDPAGRATSGSFSDDRFVQYAGVTNPDDVSEGTTDDSTASDKASDLKRTLVEYDMTGKAVRTTPLADDDTISSMSKLTGDFYVGEGEASFKFYHYDSASREMKDVYDIDNVSSWTVRDNKAYMQAGTVLYQFSPGKNGQFGLHSLFSSSSYHVSEVFSSSVGILFTGYAGNDSNAVLNIYQLLDTLADDSDEPSTGTGSGGNSTTDPGSIQRVEPAYTGFDAFLDGGMASSQLDSLKIAINTFIATLPRQVDTVSITGVNYTQQPIGTDDPTTRADFSANLSGNSYVMHIQFANYEYLQLTVKDNGETIFDSGRLADTSQN